VSLQNGERGVHDRSADGDGNRVPEALDAHLDRASVLSVDLAKPIRDEVLTQGHRRNRTSGGRS
jgi:hypothetical protein